jgi:hypothetical protein
MYWEKFNEGFTTLDDHWGAGTDGKCIRAQEHVIMIGGRTPGIVEDTLKQNTTRKHVWLTTFATFPIWNRHFYQRRL